MDIRALIRDVVLGVTFNPKYLRLSKWVATRCIRYHLNKLFDHELIQVVAASFLQTWPSCFTPPTEFFNASWRTN
ncbi:unnamed protein product [Schistosoma turkestanicum]|nr:unnamed protein product [Schistosoma turkestanicum]